MNKGNREQGTGNRDQGKKEKREERKEKRKISIFILAFIFIPFALNAQDGFGFGDSEFGFSGSAISGLSVNIGGEVRAGITGFFDYCDSGEDFKKAKLGDIFSGSLNFEAGASVAQAVINLNLTPVFDGSSPVDIDEAYLRAFFGPVTVLGGIRKLSWGRADSFGPLDVVNPIDYRDLTKLTDTKSVKIARPMIHGAWSLASFTKLEAVFVPWFQGHKFAMSGRWAPSQINLLANFIDVEEDFKDHNNTLEYTQAGTRFTTSVGSLDLGFQYYFGRLNRPRINIGPLGLNIDYNPYHQIAADFASVIAGFNLRAEAGANITGDLDGTDGTIENPAIVWSLGFDRDLVWGINLNLQGTGSFRLFHDKISSNPLDCEAGTNMSSTRITGIISRKFLRDELELKASGLWGIEDKDFLFMPAIVWSRNDVSAELSMGFFGGDREGELGQYGDNTFIKMSLSYSF